MATAGFTDVLIPYLGRTVRLVDPAQLRFTLHGRTLTEPGHLSGMRAVPPPPAVMDWSHAEKLVFPMLGNDQYGDCYYAAVAHMAQVWTGNSGTECSFDVKALTARYLKISGGDNGLDDSTIFPEFKTGIVGPNGPRKILDEMTVKPTDDVAIALAMYYFCGVILTVSLPSGWANNAAPGAIWDAGAGRTVGGHAITLTGKNAKGYYDLRTWGISPPIEITPAGLKSAGPEVIACFSADMFNPLTGLSPAGLTWDQSRELWLSLGGIDVGPSPFAPPVVPTPLPTNPYRIVLATDLPGGQLSITAGGLIVSAASSSPFTAGEYVLTHVDPLPPVGLTPPAAAVPEPAEAAP